MRTQEQIEADEDTAELVPPDPGGIWVNVSKKGLVLGNVYSSKAWADHYGKDSGHLSVRYVPESKAAELRRLLQELADVAEEFASSDPDMPSHNDTEQRFDKTLIAARASL